MTLERRFFSAPSLTQALLAAARHHSADPDAIDYQVVEKKQGFVKAPRGVVIEVDPDSPTRTDEGTAVPAMSAEERSEHPALEPVASAPSVPSTPSTEVPFEPVRGEEPAEHPALASVAPTGTQAEEPARPEESAPAEESAGVEAAATDAEAVDEPVEESSASGPFEPTQADDEPSTMGAAPAAAEFAPEAASITVDEPAPTEDTTQAVPDEPTPSAAEAPAVSDSALREAVAEAVDELAFLASLRVQVARVESSDDGLEVELEGPDSSRLAAHGGRALLAMQHLLPRLLFGRLGKAMRCHVDCDGFHAARGARLEGLAQKAAERVRSGGRSWLLEPMAPDERRLVHLALAEVPDIETESVGQGFLKRVRVAQAEQV